MRDWRTSRLTRIFVTALSLSMLLGSDRLVFGSPADSEWRLEEVKTDAETDDTVDFDGLAHVGDSIVAAAAASPLDGIDRDVLLMTPQGSRRTRGPPSGTLLSTP
jgi:hypothetical protein